MDIGDFLQENCHCKIVVVVELCNNLGMFRDVLGVWSQVNRLEQSVVTRQEALERRLAEVGASVAQMSEVERRLSGKVKRWSSVCRSLRQQAAQAQASAQEQAVLSSHPVGRYFDLRIVSEVVGLDLKSR